MKGRTSLMSAKQAISRDVPLKHNTVGDLEQQLHESLLLSGTKKRDLAAAVETLRAEITGIARPGVQISSGEETTLR
ncbi:unnamed protein product [Calypogeia fissa]